jgi:acetyl-CoA carboxylase biotin carboxyl carrier protein
VTELATWDRPDHTGASPETGPAGVLAEVRGSVLRLLAELPSLPKRIRVSAWEVAVELEWPAVDQRPPAPGQPATADSTATPAPTGRPAAGEGAPSGADAPDYHQVTAATVGTFYCRPEPGGPPFVEIGDAVRVGQQLAIVEAMKLMIPVEADVDGWVREVLKNDGEPAEFGEPLVLIERN